jgi:hypothetical protein
MTDLMFRLFLLISSLILRHQSSSTTIPRYGTIIDSLVFPAWAIFNAERGHGSHHRVPPWKVAAMDYLIRVTWPINSLRVWVSMISKVMR